MVLVDALAIARKVMYDELAYQDGERTTFNLTRDQIQEAYDVIAEYHNTLAN